MKKPNPIVELLLAIITLGVYPMRKAAKAKREATQSGSTPGIAVPPPSEHIDTTVDSMPASPQPMTTVTPPAPVVGTPPTTEEPTVTPPPTPMA